METKTITITKNVDGDTLRLTQITDRTRASAMSDVRSKKEDVRVRVDTVYVEKRDSSYVQNTNGTNGTNNGGTGSVTPSVPKLTISRTGTGTSTVTVNGEGVTSGSEVAAGTEVIISVTPAEGTTPTASLNGSTVTLTESDGVYNGTFSMPSANATLVINSGGATGGGSGDMN